MYAATINSFPTTSRELALELLALLRELDPAGWRDSLSAAARERLQWVSDRVDELLRSAPQTEVFAALYARLQELARALDEYTPQLGLGLSSAERKEAWMRLRGQLALRYDALARTLRELEVHVPSLRPTNYRRNLFHVANAVLCLLLVEVLLTQPQLAFTACSVAIWAWSCEISRRRWPAVNRALMRVLGPIAHPHEHWRVNSATWYSTAIALLALTGEPLAQVTGVVVLGVGDPLAAIVGRRFGKHKLLHGRSLEGTLTFLASGWLAAAAILTWLHALPLGAAALIALGGAVPGAIAELISRRVDDNFSIPVSAAAGAFAVVHLLGLG
ncbi:MAG: hypothetical protein R3B09_09175 [Nannocystaceae bacterium]